MLIVAIVLYLLTGIVAGLLAGLFGIGGGVIIVPVLAYLFSIQGFPPEAVMQFAVGTSIITIVGTSLSSVLAHQKLGNIQWKAVRLLSPALIIGSILGAQIAHRVSTDILTLIFTVFLWSVAVQMFMQKPKEKTHTPSRPVLLSFVATSIGILAALVGIGGGALIVPLLAYLGLNIRQAVSTSAGCALMIGLAGGISNLFVYQHKALQTVPWSTGYVYWPAALGIILMSTFMAKQGAILAHKLPMMLLQRLFALLLVLVGSFMGYMIITH